MSSPKQGSILSLTWGTKVSARTDIPLPVSAPDFCFGSGSGPILSLGILSCDGIKNIGYCPSDLVEQVPPQTGEYRITGSRTFQVGDDFGDCFVYISYMAQAKTIIVEANEEGILDDALITFKGVDFKRFIEHFEMKQGYDDRRMDLETKAQEGRSRFIFYENGEERDVIPFEEKLVETYFVQGWKDQLNRIGDRSGVSRCLICGDSWLWKRPHIIPHEPRSKYGFWSGCFPFCEECAQTRTLEEKLNALVACVFDWAEKSGDDGIPSPDDSFWEELETTLRQQHQDAGIIPFEEKPLEDGKVPKHQVFKIGLSENRKSFTQQVSPGAGWFEYFDRFHEMPESYTIENRSDGVFLVFHFKNPVPSLGKEGVHNE